MSMLYATIVDDHTINGVFIIQDLNTQDTQLNMLTWTEIREILLFGFYQNQSCGIHGQSMFIISESPQPATKNNNKTVVVLKNKLVQRILYSLLFCHSQQSGMNISVKYLSIFDQLPAINYSILSVGRIILLLLLLHSIILQLYRK